MNPCVSFGIPVRNGIGHIEKLIESILNQTFQDFEIVISDNASSDGTQELLKTLEKKDSRIRCFYNERNIGILENDNRVFNLSRGRYFRWIGVDDWLEPSFTSECINMMEKKPNIIGVTTHTVMHYDDGLIRCTKYEGERLESKDSHRRFVRLMWLLSKGLIYYSPLSGLYRRDAMGKTNLLQIVPDADLILVAELSFVGPFGHISKHLVHRTRPSIAPSERNEIYKQLHPERWKELRHSYWNAFRRIALMILKAQLSYDKKIIYWIVLTRWFMSILPVEILKKSKILVIRLLPKGHKLLTLLDKPKARD
jgi:glycosyltransferase involved in cell wall biosynthesis